jgi:Skp family chaperone for outer membrane proteins
MEDRSVKRTTISVVIAVVLLFGVHGYAAEKVGYINVQRIVSNSDMGKELVARILRKVDPLLEKIAKKRDYTIIIKDPNALAYLSPKADLSDEVVKSLNAARD